MHTEVWEYQGGELQLFEHARSWKRYWSSCIRPLIAGDVLEVGAGLGVNTSLLMNPQVRSWRCLEPDRKLAAELARRYPDTQITVGTTADVVDAQFDAVLYIDVLEHIELDRQELERAAGLLRPGGRIVVLSPAHQFLFSPFDAAIGHCRRYNQRTLAAAAPPGCLQESIYYLDCGGMMTSLANRALLKQSMPTLAQIRVWDRFVVPLSRVIDPLLGYRVGKTIVAVWRRA